MKENAIWAQAIKRKARSSAIRSRSRSRIKFMLVCKWEIHLKTFPVHWRPSSRYRGPAVWFWGAIWNGRRSSATRRRFCCLQGASRCFWAKMWQLLVCLAPFCASIAATWKPCSLWLVCRTSGRRNKLYWSAWRAPGLKTQQCGTI